MNLILVADNVDNSKPVAMAVAAAGHHVVKQLISGDEAISHIAQSKPDGMIVVSDRMDRETLNDMHTVMATKPLPIIVFTRDSTPASIDAAVKAGATAYVVDCADMRRISALLRVAQTRFNEQQVLHKELAETKNALQSRKHIEKAKGIIMQQKNLSEEQAYKAMRKLAMNNNKRIGDIAEQVIAAAEVLV